MKIGIVDYGMGNLFSISTAIKHACNCDVILSHDLLELKGCDKLILPGVGNFSTAARTLKQTELTDVINHLVIELRKPVLGICLGMQLLGKSSNEGGLNEGLGLFNGEVREFNTCELKIPHVGFNQVKTWEGSRLFSGLSDLSDFYFTHSFRMISPVTDGVSTCNYGENFVAAFEADNIAGVQFHPELSQSNGLHLLKNFVELF